MNVLANFVLTAECDRGFFKEREGKRMGELCVDSRLCYVNWMKFRNGWFWGNCVLRANCVTAMDKL